jgi:hypothetical protein
LACKTDKIDARVLATLSARDVLRGLRGADQCRQARVRIRRQRRTRRTRRDRAVGESATTGSGGRPRPGVGTGRAQRIASRRSAARSRFTSPPAPRGATLLVEIRLDGQKQRRIAQAVDGVLSCRDEAQLDDRRVNANANHRMRGLRNTAAVATLASTRQSRSAPRRPCTASNRGAQRSAAGVRTAAT